MQIKTVIFTISPGNFEWFLYDPNKRCFFSRPDDSDHAKRQRLFFCMIAKDIALSALGQIRALVIQSQERSLHPDELRNLEEALGKLTTSLADDAWAVRQLEAIEDVLLKESSASRSCSADHRDDIVLNCHALSGYIHGL